MLLDKIIKVRVSNRTKRYFLDKGYVEYFGFFSVKPEDMNGTNRTKVMCQCEYCDKISKITWSNYVIQINRSNIYSCHRCHFNKTKIKFLEKYGIENIQNLSSVRTKCKETCMLKYGFDNPRKNKIVNDKVKLTLMRNYGVDHPMKSEEIFNKAQMSAYKHFKFDDTDLKYQGTYELDFIKFCIKSKIHIKNGPIVNYSMSGKNRKYYSDFYLPDYNLVCEVKSLYTFNDDYDENLLKQKFTIDIGYSFLFIIDKDYTELLSKLNYTSFGVIINSEPEI
jgi:hypothetical protein